jgi:uncharacterized protein (TIGR02246 family)
MSRHLTSRHTTSRHLTGRHTTSRHTTSRHLTGRKLISNAAALATVLLLAAATPAVARERAAAPVGGATAPAKTGPVTAGPAKTGPVTAGPANAGATGGGVSGDLAALRALRERQEAAWADGDAAAYAAVYTPDADLITFNGDHLRGRAGIEQGMGYYFETYLGGTRLLQRDERIRFVEPDLVIIVREGCVLWPGETECTTEALSVNTNTAVKRHGRWLYTSFQNTRIRPLRPE